MNTDVESLWIFALASKCQSLSPFNTIALAFLALLSCITINLIVWSHPGGPAWGAYKWRRRNSNSPPIPGPRGLPVIGSMDLMTGLAHRKIAAAAASCGAKRLMAFSLGQTRAVVTCNPEVAREILNSGTFSDRPVKESAYHLMFNRSIGFAPYGVYWTALRKMAAQHLFCPRQVRAAEKQRLDIANQVAALLAASISGGGGVRVRDALKVASLNNMMCSVFGSAGADAAELHDLVEQGYHLLGLINWSDHLSFLADLDLQKIRLRCSRLVPRVNRFVARIIQQRKAEGGGAAFLDVLLSLRDPDRLSDSDMIAVLWEMIFRGTDTVAVLMEWILARLVLHPDVQSKVQDELDKVVGRSRAVSESDLTELVYLTAVVKEVLRLHPPGPLLSWSRLSIRDSLVDGYHVPAGTTAIVNMWAIMTDPRVWDDPLTFNPDRFLAPDFNTDFSVFGSDLRIAPFGSGRRSCPGKALGMTTVNFWVATLLQQFQFHSSGQRVDLSELLRLSCEMANPLVVQVQSRRILPTSNC
uniref:Cytochrome P450 CYP78A115 n=1 Tax=Salvia miltiorrhiza TaxID=226208 RepID=A0A0B4VSE8_SALMI|nr:cytochrome P450 CYP78A115 [Salvia miltiorrhiza]